MTRPDGRNDRKKSAKPRYNDHDQACIYAARSQVAIYKDLKDNDLEMPNRIL